MTTKCVISNSTDRCCVPTDKILRFNQQAVIFRSTSQRLNRKEQQNQELKTTHLYKQNYIFFYLLIETFKFRFFYGSNGSLCSKSDGCERPSWSFLYFLNLCARIRRLSLLSLSSSLYCIQSDLLSVWSFVFFPIYPSCVIPHYM